MRCALTDALISELSRRVARWVQNMLRTVAHLVGDATMDMALLA